MTLFEKVSPLTPLQTLKQTFGYNSFRDSQETVVEAILAGHDTLTILPTGSGKSLCYQLPAVLQDGITIVVSPLIALMQDQVMDLQKLGVKAAFLASTLDATDRAQVFRDLDQLDLLYVSPERLMMPEFLETLSQHQIATVVIDEAHCISQWGHAFRPEYHQLGAIKTTLGVPVAAFTATATPKVAQDIAAQLKLVDPVITTRSFDRPNLTIRMAERMDAKRQVCDFIDQHPDQSGIVYCNTRKKVDQFSDFLAKKGYSVGAYHAGMTDEARHKTHVDFLRDDIRIVVATVAFGMGIHKPDIRFVCHVTMPQSIEHYYQEIGRAGRDGFESDVLMLYSLQDVIIQKRFADEIADTAARYHSQRKTEQLFALCTDVACRRIGLLGYFGEETSQRTCEKCDNCKDEIELEDGTLIAQKILSCVYRLRQSFGLTYVIDVLNGANQATIKSRGHDQLSTYGLLGELTKSEIRAYMFQLINSGYIRVTDGEYPTVKLTPKSREILYDKHEIQFRKRKTKPAKKAKSIVAMGDIDHDLLAQLKTLRKQLADKRNMAPFMIFHDKALIEMAKAKPKNEAEMLQINGVGPRKLSQYGAEFLKVLA